MIKRPSVLVWFVLLLIIGAVLAFTLPPNPTTLHELHITANVYHAAVLTFILPYAIIWFSAFYAFEKLDQYANKINRTREGEPFKRIANGVGVLAWGLAVTTIVSIILGGAVAYHPGLLHLRTLINSYLAMFVSLSSFSIISRGTRQLDETVKVRPSRNAVQLLILLFTIIGAFFVSLVIRSQDTGHNPYQLALPVLILSLIVPHMYAWFIGLYSAYEMYLYSRCVSGVLYKHALSYFMSGFALVVTSAIAVQYITGAYITKTTMTLGSVLVLFYSLLTVEAAGYALIVLAAKRLKRLEEV